jgi:hypothetical protein
MRSEAIGGVIPEFRNTSLIDLNTLRFVIPEIAKQLSGIYRDNDWIPAFAGMT